MKGGMDAMSLIGLVFLFVLYFLLICEIVIICAECCETNDEIDHDVPIKKGLTDFDT